MRLKVLALMAVAGAVTAAAIPSSSARSLAQTWTGTWSTNFGTMTLTQSGSAVEGNYTHDKGHLRGTASGNVLRGQWDEAPTRAAPGDAGDFEFTLSADGRSWSGRWRYARAGDTWKTDWHGTCSAGACRVGSVGSTMHVFFGVGATDESLLGNLNSSLQGSGKLTGDGTALGAQRLEPVPRSGLHDAPASLTFADHGTLRSRRYRLTVVSGRYHVLSRQHVLTLSVEVTDSDDQKCGERSGARPGVRGKLLLVKKLEGADTVTLELACGIRREWRIEDGFVLEAQLKKQSP